MGIFFLPHLLVCAINVTVLLTHDAAEGWKRRDRSKVKSTSVFCELDRIGDRTIYFFHRARVPSVPLSIRSLHPRFSYSTGDRPRQVARISPAGGVLRESVRRLLIRRINIIQF